MKKIISLALSFAALAFAATSFAAVNQSSKLSPRSLVLAHTPTKVSIENPIVSAYITVEPEQAHEVASALSALGGKVTLNLGATLTARLPLSTLSQISDIEGIKYIQVATRAHQTLDVVRPEIGISAVHSASALPKPFTGKGVILGVVDYGFDYAHAAFEDANGNLRIRRVWEQGTDPTGNLSSPEPFGYGTEFTTPEQILASGGDVRNNSHGTHVASLAAGSDYYMDGAHTGMAPDADIVLVSFNANNDYNVNITNAIAYIFNYAESVGKPCVINLSLGASSGPHDGTSTFDVTADLLQGPGRLIVGAAGNQRADKFHVAHTFTDTDTPLRTFIDYKSSLSSCADKDIEVWASKDADVEVALLAYKTSSGDVAERVVVYPTPTTEPLSVSLGRNISGNFTAVGEVSPLNGKPHLLLTNAVTSIRAGYAVAIEVKSNTPGANVDIWAVETLGLTSNNVPGFTDPAGSSTICEIGGTAKRILTVGAYTTRSKYTPLGETVPRSLNETDGAISSFSSFGPTADGRIKPNVAAPGCFISSAVSSFDASGTLTYSQYHELNGHTNFYGFMQGTSMASPIVAGTVATWLQAWPEMTPEDLLEVVASTARTDSFTGALAQPDNDWGFGKIDALAGIKECIKRAPAGVGDIIAAPAQSAPAIVATDSSDQITLTFTQPLSPAHVQVFTPAGILVAEADVAAVTPGTTASLSTSAQGILLVRISSANSCHTIKIRK